MFVRTIQRKSSHRNVAVQIVESYRNDKGQPRQRILRHIGTAPEGEVLEQLKLLAHSEMEKMRKYKPLPLLPVTAEASVLAADRSVEEDKPIAIDDARALVDDEKWVVGFHEVGLKLLEEFHFDKLFPKARGGLWRLFAQMVLMRLAEPGASKRRAVARLRSHFGVNVPFHRVYRMMDNLSDGLIERVQRIVQREAQALLGAKCEVLFFDATTLYFEVNNADELRNNGWSKDGKSQHVQVVLALVQTAEGLPIGYELFPGNTADVSTLLPVVRKLQGRFDISRATLVADSGMLSRANIAALRELNCDYLLAARLGSISDEKLDKLLAELEHQTAGADGTRLLDTEHDGRRLVLSYSPSLARKQRHERAKLIEKLQKKLGKGGKGVGNLIGNSKYRKWVKVDDTNVAELDVEAIEAQESRLDGVRGIFTSLSTEVSQASAIKARYAELWRIEHGFRVLKSDLRMRPIFHWKQERIKAHVAICFSAYVLLAHLHYRVNLSAGDLGRMSPAAILDHLSGVQVTVVTDTNSGNQFLVPSQTTREQQAIYTAAGAKLVRTTKLRSKDKQNPSENQQNTKDK